MLNFLTVVKFGDSRWSQKKEVKAALKQEKEEKEAQEKIKMALEQARVAALERERAEKEALEKEKAAALQRERIALEREKIALERERIALAQTQVQESTAQEVTNSVTTNPYDVILLKNGQEIKAKVFEITEQQVKYKDFDYQSGPVRNINKYEIFMITYENGKKEVFNKQPSTPTSEINYDTKLKNEFERIGNNDYEMLEFFMRNRFPNYYDNFQSACSKRESGKALLGVGLGVSGLGIVLLSSGLAVDNYDLWVSGSVFMGVGGVLTIVSIPVSASAGAKKKAIKNDFSRKMFGINNYSYQPKLDFGLTATGVGITLNF